MAKTAIIIDAEGLTASLGGVDIDDINSIAFSVGGEKKKINLTTVENVKWKTSLYSYLKKIDDITINKKSDPVADPALYSTDPEALVIGYKIGNTTAKLATFQAQYKGASASTVEREPGDGVNTDLTFLVTNLNSSLVETGPAITTPA